MVLKWRRLLFAGVAGFACGNVYTLAKKHPDTIHPILQYSAAAGAMGMVLGWGVAVYRNTPSYIHALSLGANFAIASAGFLGTRHGILWYLESMRLPKEDPDLVCVDADPRDSALVQRVAFFGYGQLTNQNAQYFSSISSGGIVGALLSLASRYGLRSVIMTSSGGMLVGLCGQYAYDRFDLWRKRKAIELHYPELVESREESKWTWQKLQSRFLGFWHQRSKSGAVDEQLVVLEEAVEEERRKVAELDRLLRERTDEHKSTELDNVISSERKR